MDIHSCPVCGAAHQVHPILHALAYGRQLTCSARCKSEFPRLVYSRIPQNGRILQAALRSPVDARRRQETAIAEALAA